MKRFVVLLAFLFCGFAFADTINLHWKNYDGTTYQDSTCVVDSDLILPSTPPTRYGYTFTGWKLANYIPIEYLESTGTQWIDTTYVPNRDTRIKTRIKYKSIENNKAIVFGSGKEFSNECIEYSTWEGKAIFSYYNSNSAGAAVKIGDTVSVDFNKNIVNYSVNDISQSQISFQYGNYWETSQSMRIFAVNRPYTLEYAENVGRIEVYYFQIYDNNVLVRDFIPVLDMNGIPCLFDRVESKFYYNQGTGNFIAGPVISE